MNLDTEAWGNFFQVDFLDYRVRNMAGPRWRPPQHQARGKKKGQAQFLITCVMTLSVCLLLVLMRSSPLEGIASTPSAVKHVPVPDPSKYHLRQDGTSSSMSSLKLGKSSKLVFGSEVGRTQVVAVPPPSQALKDLPRPTTARPIPSVEVPPVGNMKPSTSAPRRDSSKRYSGLIFVKTYKTASTTVAMILNSIAFKLRLKCLHPLDKGWFKEGELKLRVAQGQAFEMSFRHMSPVLELDVLQDIVPNAFLTTIVRNPVTKFNSMFNFVQTTSAKYKTIENFVAAVKSGKASINEKNDLCNNLAYSMSGAKESLAGHGLKESVAYASKMIEDFESRGMFVMVMERMTESMVVVCERMKWDCYSGDIPFKDTKERQNNKGGTVKCKDESCKALIKSVNEIDWIIYDYYAKKLDEEISTIQDFGSKLAKLKNVLETSSGNAQKYPVNCKKTINPAVKEFEEIHQCDGNKGA